ncbi:MAG TPA: amino acid adenylation domain-containing protein, partial [Longimicrobiaceae bacterium]|nr:amino acid adenylation domain-containing protein [Longimicrobiaceae bacterium]
RGVGREEVVAVYAHRSASLVWALLGVLGAGGAFLVLDPAYPAARLARQLRAAGPRALLRLESAGPLPAEIEAWLEKAGVPHLALPPRSAAERTGFLAGEAAEAPAVAVGPDDAAYLAFTSGTTGEPRGIVGTHRPLAHFVAWQRDAFGLGADDRFALLSGLAHDPLLRDVFTPLSLGAALCIPDPRELGTPGYLARWTAAEGITVVHLTPAMGQLLGSPGEAPPLPLRHAFWGGEKVRFSDASALAERAPRVESVVFYGTTETPQAISFFPVPRDWQGPEVLPVGRGIEGVQLLVLTPAGGLAGIGEVGEISVSTPYLARGYLRDEPGTRERFVASPFTGDPAVRVYRTGDLGRYRPDGTVQILGRMDQQVKLRGFRIEPGEIEAVLVEQEEVREAAVTVREDAPGQQRLVAYVVPAEGAEVSAAELRARLGTRLPEHMVPGAFVTLERLPLTANGKLDRRALPAPEWSGEGAYVAPRTPVEEVLAGILGEVLRVERVGVEDSFFELGGHSLLATRVVSRVRQALEVELPLRALFEAPTVAALAVCVEGLLAGGEGTQAPPLVALPRDGSALPLSFAQQRLWFVDQLEPGSAAYNMPHALRLRGRFDPAVLERAVTEIVRRHETLRTVFAVVGGEPVQVIRGAAPVALPVADLRSLPAEGREAEARRLAREEAARPFDLVAGPLLRASAVRLDEAEWAVLFTLH